MTVISGKEDALALSEEELELIDSTDVDAIADDATKPLGPVGAETDEVEETDDDGEES